MIRQKIATWLGVVLMAWLFAGAVGAEETAETGSPGSASQPERLSLSLGLNPEALAERYPDQALWLDTPEHGRAVVLFEREHRGDARGALLILADEGQTAGTQLAGALREPLARKGWAAMSMGLPPMPMALRQGLEAKRERSDQGASGPSPGDESTADSERGEADREDGGEASVMIDVMAGEDLADLSDIYTQGIQAHLAAALRELRRQGYERLVLAGIGRGAEHVTRQAMAGGEGQLSLVWIAPVFQFDGEGTLAAELQTAGSIDLLDLVSSRQDIRYARERAALMQRQQISSYSQQRLAMPGVPVSRNAGQVVNRMLAWLGRQG
ncbi:DUF3530 family protein [Marinobacter sp.]|uniref:DUF3530 family protein n=1 Tax=Marinobacter sp. TaxID=50741 RepID=UPI00384B8EC2